MAYNLERRQSPRKRFDNLLYVEVEPGNGGMVLNFSEHGFGFRAVKRVRPKEEVKFAFNLADHRRLEGRGRLEWADKEGRVAGLQFTDVSDEFRAEIRKWLSASTEFSAASPRDVSGSAESEPSHAESLSRSLAARQREAVGKAAPFKGARSLSVVPSQALPANPIPLSEPELETLPGIRESSDASYPADLPWAATLPPALGAERRPVSPRPSLRTEQSGATAFKFDGFDSTAMESADIAEEPQTPEAFQPAPGIQIPRASLGMTSSAADAAEIELRTAAALNEHARSLLQHFQHEEESLMAGFRDSAARVLRDSERQLFPIREAVQAQMKSLESSVASAASSAKVLDQYPALLERAQQQALDRFQIQINEVLNANVAELRRRSELLLEEADARSHSTALLPRRIRTSSGIIGTAIIVALLALLFTFRREAANAFIWLGQQMVEPAQTTEARNSAPPASAASGSPADNKATDYKIKTEPAQITPPESSATPKELAKPAPPATATPAPAPKSVRAMWDLVATGDVEAELTLGNMYFTGHGVTKNCSQARRLFAAAARKGNEEARQKLAELDRGACA